MKHIDIDHKSLLLPMDVLKLMVLRYMDSPGVFQFLHKNKHHVNLGLYLCFSSSKQIDGVLLPKKGNINLRIYVVFVLLELNFVQSQH